MKGYYNKYVFIDLTNNKVRDYPIPDEWYMKYLGGRGIAARILFKELDPNVEPFSEENILVFATGPFQGLGIAGASRFLVMGKSPKTNNLNDSFCGGTFGHILGKSGYDGIIVKGKSKNPVYISLDNGETKIVSAENLWGLDPLEVEAKLKGNRKGTSIACIGKAGENKVIHSCIMVDRTRALGRPGYGAIMGSKNLKAIVVAGNKSKEVVDIGRLNNLKKEFAKKVALTGYPKVLSEYGTPNNVEFLSDNGMLPTKNFQNGQYFYANKISGQTLRKSNFWVKRDTCPGCPVKCKSVVTGMFNKQKFEPEWGGPEYETVASFGSNLLNNNLSSICFFNKKCNQYGLDTISVGVQIAYLMEATEKGLLKEEDQIKWGDTKAIDKLIDKIANREGIGEWVARGTDYISKKVGDGSFLIHCKGEEVAMHDPRGKYSHAVYYATTPRGGNHMEGIFDPTPPHGELNLPENPARSWKDRAKIAGDYLHLRSFANSLILCAFTSGLVGGENEYFFPLFRDMLEAVTGRKIDIKEMLTIGERNYALLRFFAEKVGYTRKDDKLLDRFHEAQPSTGYLIEKKMLEDTINEYYAMYHYDKYGPSVERRKQLDIDIIDL